MILEVVHRIRPLNRTLRWPFPWRAQQRSTQPHHVLLCLGFALCVKGDFRPPHERLAQSTVNSAVSNVCASFRENSQPNPTKDNDLQSSFLLQRLYRSFMNADPKEKQQKAVPPCVVAKPPYHQKYLQRLVKFRQRKSTLSTRHTLGRQFSVFSH
jgi:hypothetical protein